MAASASSITHSLHLEHPLFLRDSCFTCAGCMLPGSGPHYCCNACNFDLHHHCATCLSVVSCSLHPQHQLSLHYRQRSTQQFCDRCRHPVGGMHYRCDSCNFNLHPHCTQLMLATATTSVPPGDNTGNGDGDGGGGGGAGRRLLLNLGIAVVGQAVVDGLGDLIM